MRPPYRDVVQNALYGRSGDTLNLLCEDSAAEGILQGVFDVLLPRERIRRESVRVGRDTGASEFPMHATAFRKFGQIRNFVFVLDGDKRDSDLEQRICARAGTDVPVLFLPGEEAPEVWIWNALRRDPTAAADLGLDPGDLAERMNRLDAIYDTAADRHSERSRRPSFTASPNPLAGWAPTSAGWSPAWRPPARRAAFSHSWTDSRGHCLQWRAA